jgi:hypothetical protein
MIKRVKEGYQVLSNKGKNLVQICLISQDTFLLRFSESSWQRYKPRLTVCDVL